MPVMEYKESPTSVSLANSPHKLHWVELWMILWGEDQLTHGPCVHSPNLCSISLLSLLKSELFSKPIPYLLPRPLAAVRRMNAALLQDGLRLLPPPIVKVERLFYILALRRVPPWSHAWQRNTLACCLLVSVKWHCCPM